MGPRPGDLFKVRPCAELFLTAASLAGMGSRPEAEARSTVMRYDESDRESENVEDRRGQRGGGFRFPGGGGRGIQIPIPMGRGGGGFSITTLLIIGAIMLLFGLNP